MTPALAAVLAARETREAFPDEFSMGVVLQAVGHRRILSCIFENPDSALAAAGPLGIAATELILTADSYHQTIDPQREPMPNRGDLQQRYLLGDPDVVECLMVMVASRTDLAVTMLPYRREGRVIVWLPFEPTDTDVVDAGSVPEALQDALSVRNPITGPNADEVLAWMADSLRELLGVPTDLMPYDPEDTP
jgi:hypothetical protein